MSSQTLGRIVRVKDVIGASSPQADAGVADIENTQ